MSTAQTIGRMREVVTFMQNTPTRAESGGGIDHYSVLLTTRGQLIDSGASRGLQFGAITDSTSARLIVRFQTALADALRSDTKIVISNVTYTMNGMPKLIDQIKHLYEFSINAQTN